MTTAAPSAAFATIQPAFTDAERAIDLASGERTEGPVFLAKDRRRLNRHGAGRIVRTTARRAGIGTLVTPHSLRNLYASTSSGAGVPLRDVQEAASDALGTRLRNGWSD